jgi:hypothetical protein
MSANSDKFWVEDPCVLFTNLEFFPVKNMTKSEKLNALTRLVIIVSLLLYVMENEQWFVFLTLSMLIIIIMNYQGEQEKFKKSKLSTKEEKPEKEAETVLENFSITPTYSGSDFQQTIVAPTFAEEWQIPPPAYDIYTQIPYPNPENQSAFEAPLTPQSYPYGQYLTKTNLLPSDEYYINQGCGGAKTAREYQNSNFLRHDLAHRENMSRIHKKKLDRRFRHNCHDTYSPFTSY